MSLSNPSELLLKNSDLLQANNALFVNCPDALFLSHWSTQNENSKATSLHYNYADYLATNRSKIENIAFTFTHDYQSETLHDLVVIYFPKSKAELQYTLAMINSHITEDALLLFVGDNKGGVKTVSKLVKEQTSWCRKESSAKHCSLFIALFNGVRKPFEIEQWYTHTKVSINDTEFTLSSLPGVFSHERLDKGTQVLLNHLPNSLKGKVLDFGCGAGPIAIYALKNNKDSEVEMLDVNALALASSKKSLEKNNLSGKVYASDSLHQVTGTYDVVLSNPPFHQGIKTNYAATEYFLNFVGKHLTSTGALHVIANNFLRYKPIMESHFKHYKQLANQQGFTHHFCTGKK